MPPRRRRAPPRRSSSQGAVFACAAAGVALVLVMGVTVSKRGADRSAQADLPAPAASRVTPPFEDVAPFPRARVRKAAHPLDAMTRTVAAVGKRMPSIRGIERGPEFESARVGALADLSTVREALGAYLDEHPSDDRGHRLWDRLQALYVALKKL